MDFNNNSTDTLRAQLIALEETHRQILAENQQLKEMLARKEQILQNIYQATIQQDELKTAPTQQVARASSYDNRFFAQPNKTNAAEKNPGFTARSAAEATTQHAAKATANYSAVTTTAGSAAAIAKTSSNMATEMDADRETAATPRNSRL